MNNFGIHIEIPEGKVKDILDRLTAAQKTIFDCYEELERLGVVTVREKTASAN